MDTCHRSLYCQLARPPCIFPNRQTHTFKPANSNMARLHLPTVRIDRWHFFHRLIRSLMTRLLFTKELEQEKRPFDLCLMANTVRWKTSLGRHQSSLHQNDHTDGELECCELDRRPRRRWCGMPKLAEPPKRLVHSNASDCVDHAKDGRPLHFDSIDASARHQSRCLSTCTLDVD